MENLLKEILGQVSKPTRYIGNEWNSVHKDIAHYTLHNTPVIRVALAFPDLYEIGMSHLGMNILYYLLNKQENVIAERVYTPWVDMEEKLRKNKIPLFSLETHTPLKEFDIIGFSLQYELCYTNVLTILDLAGIPLKSSDRDENSPLIIAGGASAFNPEPICEFIDLFVVGEAEDAILEIVSKCQNAKARHSCSRLLPAGVNSSRNRIKRIYPTKRQKQEILREMAKIEGVYIPSFYEVKSNSDGTINSINPKYSNVPSKIKKRIVCDVDSAFCPLAPIVPYQSIIHDRAVIEVFRGCTQGCRFCQAGMISRPVRMRSLNSLCEKITKLIENTGWEEISLLALNICDYPAIEEVVLNIAKKYAEKGVKISLPSLRSDNFSILLAQLISMGAHVKPTLTFAPEAGTQRLRDIINKRISQDELVDGIGNAYRAGWGSCKLYFMVGLPGETDEDIEGIIKLANELKKTGRKIKPGADIRLSISPFVPKSHTPFQWEPQDKIEILREKQKKILSGLRKTEVRWHSPESNFLEGIFARGDRRLNEVILRAWKNGARFDAWEETFNFSIWEKTFQELGIDPSFYLYRKRDYDEILPWEHIDTGVDKKFLINENKKSKEGITTPNCLFEECQNCGVCDKIGTKIGTVPLRTIPISVPIFAQPSSEVHQRIRITFSKGDELKYISHLDLHRLLTRALKRADIPVTFSKGFHQHPEIILGLPLSVGMISESELCDIFLSERMELDEFIKRLASQLPDGLKLKKAEEVLISAPSLPNVIKGVKYNVVVQLGTVPFTDVSRKMGLSSVIVGQGESLPVVGQGESLSVVGQGFSLAEKILAFLNQKEIVVHRKTPKSNKTINIRPLIENIKCNGAIHRNVAVGFIRQCSGRVYSADNNLTLEISLKVSNESGARPDEVVIALFGPNIKILEINRTEIKI